VIAHVQHSTEHVKTWISGSQETWFVARKAGSALQNGLPTFQLLRVERETKWRCEKETRIKGAFGTVWWVACTLLNDTSVRIHKYQTLGQSKAKETYC
jgi:hypothetical protein